MQSHKGGMAIDLMMMRMFMRMYKQKILKSKKD